MSIRIPLIAVPVLLIGLWDSLAQAGCPPPTVTDRGGNCVLDADATLAAPLQLSSGTHLNCKGHTLSPAVAGIEDNPATTHGTCVAASRTCSLNAGRACGSDVDCMINEYQPSQPVVGVLVDGASDVKIQGCGVEWFDFGILVMAVGEASPPPVKILSNTVRSAYWGILLISASGLEIADNDVSFNNYGGGIGMTRASNRNHIVRNEVSRRGNGKVLSPPPLPGSRFTTLPGAPFSPAGTLLEFVFNAAFGIITFDASFTPVTNVVIGNTVRQFPYLPDGGTRTRGNLIEGNQIDLPFRDPAGNVVAGSLFALASGDGSHGTIFRGNHVARGGRGVHVNGSTFGPRSLPARCSLDDTRWCATDRDCNLPGVDDGASKGSCPALLTTAADNNDGIVTGTVVEANILDGPYRDQGILVGNAAGTAVTSNSVGGGAPFALQLSGRGLESSTVIRNVLVGQNGLGLNQPTPPPPGINTTQAAFFASTVSLNDIVGYTLAAVRTSNGYAFDSRLDGNHWGLACPGFDASLVKQVNGAPNPSVVDDDPYGVPVSMTPDALLPAPCF